MSSKTKMPDSLFDESLKTQAQTKLRTGKYKGDCPKCKLVLASFDVTDGIVKCPSCGAKTDVKALKPRTPYYATQSTGG